MFNILHMYHNVCVRSVNCQLFVSALQTLGPLPTRQHVAELPDINWKSYMDSVERVTRQHSAVYLRTRRKASGKEATTLTKMVRFLFSASLQIDCGECIGVYL